MEIILILIALAIYFTPTVMAWGKNNATSIFMLNLFLGWTFIGWVAALVWAFKKDAPPVVVYQQNNDQEEKLRRFKKLLDDGIISQQEFDKKKEEILG